MSKKNKPRERVKQRKRFLAEFDEFIDWLTPLSEEPLPYKEDMYPMNETYAWKVLKLPEVELSISFYRPITPEHEWETPDVFEWDLTLICSSWSKWQTNSTYKTKGELVEALKRLKSIFEKDYYIKYYECAKEFNGREPYCP